MADIEAGINSTANPRSSMPPAPVHQQVECEPHYLDLAFVLEGSAELGIPAGRKLEVMRWHNTTATVLKVGNVTNDEELYIVARNLGGFIWVPKNGTPALSTLINQVVGHGGTHLIYKDVTGRGVRDARVGDRVGIAIGSKPQARKSRAETYELWAVPADMHERRVAAPGEAATSVHRLFPLQNTAKETTDN